MGIKDFFVKQVLKSKLKNVPEAERERLMELIDKNPDFFKKIGVGLKKPKVVLQMCIFTFDLSVMEFQPSYTLEQGCFSCSIFSNQAVNFPFFKRHVDVFQHRVGAV